MSHRFGDLLNQYRSRKHGLTQARLALLAGYDAPLITKLCQGRKELTGPSGRERVVRLIGVLRDEGALTTLDEANALLKAAGMSSLFDGQPAEAGLMSRLAHVTSQTDHPIRRTNLSAPLGHFIGRTQEVAEVRKLLMSTRLLTLTGSGGAGKTRLAQHVASNLVVNFSAGVWYVELAPLTDGALAAETVAHAVGLAVVESTANEQLIDYLRDRQALVVLDNCEHLIDAVAMFTVDLLRACPRVSVLATSREALKVDGEIAWRVPPMQPAEAAQLFVERAHAARPDIDVVAQDATVAWICRRLDGMPLALELAAARLQGMSLNELSRRLDDRFALLIDGRRDALPRHQTLRAVIDWSYDLLSETERILLRRLAVFVGGWTADSAEQVCAEGSLPATTVLPVLLSLVNKSLVVADAEQRDGETRYRLLETIRDHALQKLVEHGEWTTLQRRHAEAFAALAEQAYTHTHGSEQRQWMARLERDYLNLHAALAWCFAPAGDALAGCRIFGHLRASWLNGSHTADAQHWARLACAALTADMPARVQGGVWLISTEMNHFLPPAEKLAQFQQALAYYTAAGDPHGMAEAMGYVGAWMLTLDSRDPQGYRMLAESITLARSIGDTLVEHGSLTELARIALESQAFERAEALYKETMRLCRATGDLENLAWALVHLASVHMERGQFHAALACAEEGGEVARQIDAYTIVMFAEIKVTEGVRFLGNAARAVVLGEANLAFARDRLSPSWLGGPVHALTKALNDSGQSVRAQALLVEWMKTLYQTEGLRNFWDWGAHSMDVLACVASGRREAARAARLFGVADAIFTGSGRRRFLHNDWEYAPYIAKARAALGDEAYEAATAEGRAMTPEQAVKYALGDAVYA